MREDQGAILKSVASELEFLKARVRGQLDKVFREHRATTVPDSTNYLCRCGDCDLYRDCAPTGPPPDPWRFLARAMSGENSFEFWDEVRMAVDEHERSKCR